MRKSRFTEEQVICPASAAFSTPMSFIESFNGKFRDECLNEHWFRDLTDARETIDTWRQDYNDVRPHSALGNRTPTKSLRLTA